MNYQPKAIRPFIGAENYAESRAFYKALDFEEVIIDPKMSLFKVNDALGFYLQDAYVQDWVDNSMILLEVDDVEKCAAELRAKGLQEKYNKVRFSEIQNSDRWRELFMHDPSGVLWHFFEFK